MRHKIRFALPGPSADWCAVQAMLEASEQHDVVLPRGVGHSTVGNFDECWVEAQNAFEAGEADRFHMLHTDVYAYEPGYLDVLNEVMDRYNVPLVSVPIAIKDGRSLVSCGTADGDPWAGTTLMRIEDLEKLPLDFDQHDLGKSDQVLMHNNGCWLADLTDPRWRQTDANGDMLACFNFPRRNRRDPKTGLWVAQGISEDFHFSRMVHRLGIPSIITRRVKLWHRGTALFPNWDRRREAMSDRINAELEACKAVEQN